MQVLIGVIHVLERVLLHRKRLLLERIGANRPSGGMSTMLGSSKVTRKGLMFYILALYAMHHGCRHTSSQEDWFL